VGSSDDTLIVFLSDNGASCEELPKGNPELFRHRKDILRLTTRDGRPVRIGNTPDTLPGAEDTYASYGQAWANLSNTPFRFYKRWVHEGGIATPLIVHWPAGGLRDGSIVHNPFQLVDVVPTVLDALAVDSRTEGRSMLGALRGEPVAEATLYWEHTGNCAVRRERWKLVREHPHGWELYDLARDRAETRNVSGEHPDVVASLAAAYDEWADRVGLIPWERTLALYRARGASDEDAAG
jgi:arylsulfatase